MSINKATNEPFPYFYAKLTGHHAWSSRLTPTSPCGSICQWCEVYRWLLGEGKRIPPSGEGRNCLAIRQLRESALQIFTATRIYPRRVCVDLLVYLTDPRRAARIAPSRKLIYLLTGEKNCSYHRNRRRPPPEKQRR